MKLFFEKTTVDNPENTHKKRLISFEYIDYVPGMPVELRLYHCL
jgi:hypothetical protein